MVLRFDQILSRGLFGESSFIRPGDRGTGGKGGRCSTGFATSFLLTRTGAVGGGGHHGWRTLSASEESLSNRFAIAMVPRLRSWDIIGGPWLMPKALLTCPSRPHPQPSMSLGAGRAAPFVRFHKHPEVMAENEKSTHRAMLRPQTDLSW
jgi:hypothetical protein